MSGKALVIGGSGSTGPHLVEGLVERGWKVEIFHRGTHEVELPDEVEHLHGDPHFQESAEEVLAGRSYDIAIVTYGRMKALANVLAGRCGHVFGVGGIGIYRGAFGNREDISPLDPPLLIGEEGPLVEDRSDDSNVGDKLRFFMKIRAAEDAVFEMSEKGVYDATYFRVPVIYGPRNILPWEWSVLRRVVDRRQYILVPDNGHQIHSRMAGRNAAHALLTAVDSPGVARGQVYNCADDHQYSLRVWLELLVDIAGGNLEVIGLPNEIAVPGWSQVPAKGLGAPHVFLDTSKIRRELGYVDVISTEAALAESIEWYRRFPVTADSHPAMADTFDYAFEDELLNAYRKSMGRLVDQFSIRVPETHRHSYPHPRTPNLVRDDLGR
jgi:nucleoside-diphosphate-sugar epimerase